MQEGASNVENRQSSPSGAEQGLFTLRRTGHSLPSGGVQMMFGSTPRSPAAPESSLQPLPTFNLDLHHYTPSFMLPVDQAQLAETAQFYLHQHQRKLQELSEEKTDMYVPQPSKANRFCCICKEHYTDYLTHVTHPTHQHLLKESSFTAHIEELCKTMSMEQSISVDDKVTQVKRKIPARNKKISKKRKFKQCLETSTSGSTNSNNISIR